MTIAKPLVVSAAEWEDALVGLTVQGTAVFLF